MPVQLVIKAPNQKVPDHVLECELHWDVLRLKNHISEVYPTNPNPEDQRLIYAGRLIKDHLTLKDFINYEEGQKYTLHLVCSQHGSASPSHHTNTPPDNLDVPNPSSQNTGSQVRQRSQSSSPLSENDSPSPSSGGISNSPYGLPGANVMPGMAIGAITGPEMMAQQMAAMQHFYAQCMAQFMRQAQLAGLPAPYPDFTPAFANPSNTPADPAAGAPAENAPQANANRAQAAGNQNVRMNAQGGPLLDDEDEDAENRDWLDWFYIFSRALVLFSILFFYSSLGRFMVVTGVAILIYMYQGGWFGVRMPQAPQVAPRQAQAPPPPQPVDGEEAAEDGELNQDAQPQNREPVSSPAVQREQRNEDQEEIQNMMDLMDGNQEPNHRSEPSLIQTFWLFLTSFFVSLIPEQPPPVNIN